MVRSSWFWIGLAIAGIPVGYVAGWFLFHAAFTIVAGHQPIGRQEELVGLPGGLLGLILGCAIPLVYLRRIWKQRASTTTFQPTAADTQALGSGAELLPAQIEAQPQRAGLRQSILNIIFGNLSLIAGIATLALSFKRFLGPLWLLLGSGLIAYGLFHVVQGVRRKNLLPTLDSSKGNDSTRLSKVEPEAGDISWIDKQIANMSFLGLLLSSLVPLAFPIAWVGLVLCRHPKARRRAWVMVAVQVLLVFLAIAIAIVQRS